MVDSPRHPTGMLRAVAAFDTSTACVLRAAQSFKIETACGPIPALTPKRCTPMAYQRKSADSVLHSAPLSLKFRQSSAAGLISGFASTFDDIPDSHGDVIAPEAFNRALAAFAGRGAVPLMLWAHNLEKPIGRWLEIGKQAAGLFMTGQINLETSAGRDAFEHLKAGDLDGLSIGYRILPGGARTLPDGTRRLTDIELVEVSVVTMPSNSNARVTSVKSFGSRAELESRLRSVLPGRAVTKLMSGGWPALSADDDQLDETQLNELAAALRAARADIRNL